ncbi:hypothetical protein [Nocardia niwae]|uniref:hypothetical protein n=1 Tax=Nocardia niwae TaxID=626084 RepID=UPI0033EA8B5A
MPEPIDTSLVVTLHDEMAELIQHQPLDSDAPSTTDSTRADVTVTSEITWIGAQLLRMLREIDDPDIVRALAQTITGHAQRLTDLLAAGPVNTVVVADHLLGELPDPLRQHVGLDQNREFHPGQWRTLAEILIEIRRLVELAEDIGMALVPDHAVHVGGTTTVREVYLNALVKMEPLIDYAAGLVADHVSAPAAKASLLRAAGQLTTRPPTVTLCGSMRFHAHMLTVAAELTDAGVIVLAPFRVVAPADQDSAAKTRLDELHRRKIDMADWIVVVTDESRYIGESTRGEIGYATRLGKQIDWAVRPATAVAS